MSKPYYLVLSPLILGPQFVQKVTPAIYFSISSSIGPTYGASLRTGELGGRTVGYPSSGVPNIGAEFGIRQSSAQIDELKKKLKMVNMDDMLHVNSTKYVTYDIDIFKVESYS